MLTLASRLFTLVVFIGAFGVSSGSFAVSVLDVDVPITPRLSTHQVPAPFLEEDLFRKEQQAYN